MSTTSRYSPVGPSPRFGSHRTDTVASFTPNMNGSVCNVGSYAKTRSFLVAGGDIIGEIANSVLSFSIGATECFVAAGGTTGWSSGVEGKTVRSAPEDPPERADR